MWVWLYWCCRRTPMTSFPIATKVLFCFLNFLRLHEFPDILVFLPSFAVQFLTIRCVLSFQLPLQEHIHHEIIYLKQNFSSSFCVILFSSDNQHSAKWCDVRPPILLRVWMFRSLRTTVGIFTSVITLKSFCPLQTKWLILVPPSSSHFCIIYWQFLNPNFRDYRKHPFNVSH